MPPLWDTFALFNRLLANLPTPSFCASQSCTSLDEELPFLLLLAKEGFLKFAPAHCWGEESEIYLTRTIRHQLTDEELEWWEEASRAFCSLAHGAMLGMFNIDQIYENGILLGEAHLPGFLSMYGEEVIAKYGK